MVSICPSGPHPFSSFSCSMQRSHTYPRSSTRTTNGPYRSYQLRTSIPLACPPFHQATTSTTSGPSIAFLSSPLQSQSHPVRPSLLSFAPSHSSPTQQLSSRCDTRPNPHVSRTPTLAQLHNTHPSRSPTCFHSRLLTWISGPTHPTPSPVPISHLPFIHTAYLRLRPLLQHRRVYRLPPISAPPPAYTFKFKLEARPPIPRVRYALGA
ncbi:hypothetical protein BDN70DRAFT_596026 [Pholiota conissans]|uniref:Uncharacterized protein n=1 Tax=Pholiota conissans TaxID=109636 RepID=A0A9P6CT45_9AGAR|nr:hypothetical protein BDN70DRAFT_596026 [Pholiota conissans]